MTHVIQTRTPRSRPICDRLRREAIELAVILAVAALVVVLADLGWLGTVLIALVVIVVVSGLFALFLGRVLARTGDDG